MASKSKKNARYDLKAADRKRNLAVQIGLTAIVVVFAVVLVLYIVMSAEDKPGTGDAKSVRVASENLITQEGSTEPKAVLSVYEDFLCPHCAEFEQGFGPTIDKLVETGAVAVDYYMAGIMNTPQNQNYSSRAGAAAYCVADESMEAFPRFRAAIFAQQLHQRGQVDHSDAALIETARQAGAVGTVPECVKSERYVEMVSGMAGATGIKATPSLRINGEDYQQSTPEELVTKIEGIVGEVPGLEAVKPAQGSAPS